MSVIGNILVGPATSVINIMTMVVLIFELLREVFISHPLFILSLLEQK